MRLVVGCFVFGRHFRLWRQCEEPGVGHADLDRTDPAAIGKLDAADAAIGDLREMRSQRGYLGKIWRMIEFCPGLTIEIWEIIHSRPTDE